MFIEVRHRQEAEPFDIIIVGGGIQGIMLAREAARVGLRPVLLEAAGLGQQTTAGWYRILHGGLRYLQSLDLRRLRQSARERRWFARNFAEFVEPHPFVMPLYGHGLKRRSAFSAAFRAERHLTSWRNDGVKTLQRIPDSRVLDAASTAALYPNVRRERLEGGALWYDLVVRDSQGLIDTLVGEARAYGAVVISGFCVQAPMMDGARIVGVSGRFEASGDRAQFCAPTVILAAGAQNASLGGQFDPRSPVDAFTPVLAFNLLIDRPLRSQCGVAVSPEGRPDLTLFAYADGVEAAEDGPTFAGTWYVPWSRSGWGGRAGRPEPRSEDIEAFLAALNSALPGLKAERRHVAAVTSGLLPARAGHHSQLAKRPLIFDHGRAGGVEGLFTVTAVKLTTARAVARQTLASAGFDLEVREPAMGALIPAA